MENIKYLISLGSLIGTFIIVLFILLIIQNLIKKIRGIEIDKIDILANKKVIIFCCICVLCSMTTIIAKTPLGSTQIDSILEKPEYREQYYVYMYPEGSLSKNYKLEADIYSNLTEYEDNKVREYFIEKAYFPNGGYITFEDDLRMTSLEIDKKVSITDDENKDWKVVLTKEKVKK